MFVCELALSPNQCIFVGPETGSTNELGRMESPGSKRRYREENDNCKHKRSARDGTSSLRVTGVGNLPGNRKVALTDGKNQEHSLRGWECGLVLI
jgi:hypothetical protein